METTTNNLLNYLIPRIKIKQFMLGTDRYPKIQMTVRNKTVLWYTENKFKYINIYNFILA